MFDSHSHSFSRLQEDRRLNPGRPARYGTEPYASENHCQDQHHFHRRELRSDAFVRAAAEGKVCKVGKVFGCLLRPSFGAERFRVFEKARIPMDHPLTHEYLRSLGNPVSSDLAFAQQLPADGICRWINPHTLFYNALGVLEPWKVGRGRR